jgi:hypothetical protein
MRIGELSLFIATFSKADCPYFSCVHRRSLELGQMKVSRNWIGSYCHSECISRWNIGQNGAGPPWVGGVIMINRVVEVIKKRNYQSRTI